jgi:hypothetical protein
MSTYPYSRKRMVGYASLSSYVYVIYKIWFPSIGMSMSFKRNVTTLIFGRLRGICGFIWINYDDRHIDVGPSPHLKDLKYYNCSCPSTGR